jgi:hypothetical protein
MIMNHLNPYQFAQNGMGTIAKTVESSVNSVLKAKAGIAEARKKASSTSEITPPQNGKQVSKIAKPKPVGEDLTKRKTLYGAPMPKTFKNRGMK